MRHILSVAFVLASTSAASATVFGFRWNEVSNANSPYPGNAPTTLPANTRTFDLYIVGTQVGEIINGVNFGGDSGDFRIRISPGATVYNTPAFG